MQVNIHCGAHATEEDRLMKSLLRNKEIFVKTRTAVPGPGKYRELIKGCMAAMEDGRPADTQGQALWDAILDGEDTDRVILSNPHFWGSQRMALSDNQLYPHAEQRVSYLKQLFAQDDLHLHLSLRSPVGFVPALLENANHQRKRELRRDNDPIHIHWSELLLRLRRNFPEIPITVWCYEDLPMIWAQVIRHMGGIEPGARINGGMDLLSAIMSKEGMQRLRAYMHQHQELNEEQKQRVTLAFLDKYALDDEVEEELDMPDWTDSIIEEASDAYDRDLELIDQLDGVTLIST
ncbi:hypothetical protein KMP13_09990 [Epibacterium ulvae]|nr:hypothetical protein [Epibacterium ulvae]